MLTVTPKAADKINSFMQTEESARGKALRLKVAPAGCAGYEYRIAFDEKQPTDKVIAQNGFDLIIDEGSMQFVSDATIDYEESDANAGFRIKNPLEKGSCGCGKSKQF